MFNQRWFRALAVLFLVASLVGCGAAGAPTTAETAPSAAAPSVAAAASTAAAAPAASSAASSAASDSATPSSAASDSATASVAADASSEASGTAAGGSTLVMAIAEDTASLDPGRAYETAPSIIHKVLYETLVTFPADSVNEIEPLLAESWTLADNGTAYTFTLRSDATFANGSPVTAEDVVFSFNRMKNLKGNPSFLAETIASVEAADDQTVVLTLSQPDPAILAKLVFPAFSVVNRELATENGATDAEDAATTDKAETWFNSNSAGSGPYTLEKWDPGVETVLVRNPSYYGTAATIERIVMRNIPEAATQKLQLEAGDVDIAMDLSADQTSSLRNTPGVTIYEGLSDAVFFLLMNQDETIGGPLSNPQVQRAVRLAVDYEGIRALVGGQTITPASVIPSGFPGAYGQDKAITRDVAQATALLNEAGLSSGIEVELEYPELTYGGVNLGTIAQKIQADLAEAGITVTLKPAELQVALENYRQGKEQFGLWFWLPDYRDALDYVEFLPEGVVGKRAQWLEASAEPAIVELRDQLQTETDAEARVQLFGQMQDYLQQQGPYAPLLQPGLQIGLSQRVQNFVYNPQWRVDFARLGISE